MNKREAIQIISDKRKDYRSMPYIELKSMINSDPDTIDIVGRSGTNYQIEIMAVWDDIPDDNIRVVGNIDDGGLRALSPLSDGFIKSPLGEFVGE